DPVSASRLHANDLRRVVRALEVWELTGRPISMWQQEWRSEIRNLKSDIEPPRVLYLDRPRDELYSRIDQRVRDMLAAGWLDEARRLRELPRPPSREAAAAVGYHDLWDFLDGARGWDETVGLIQQRSRNYAKRQLTWFRHLPECRPVRAELTFALWESRM